MKLEKFSEDEQLRIGRAMVSAALAVFGDPSQPCSNSESVAKIVLAMRKASAERDVQRKSATRSAEGRYSFVTTEASDAVATAYWLWCDGNVLGPEDVHPQCIAADRLLSFARGMSACHQLAEARAIMSDEDFSGFSTYGCEAWDGAWTPPPETFDT